MQASPLHWAMDDDQSTAGDDLDLRLVRSFTAVAEHQHFGRAAEALHLAQPALSRQIRRLEHLIGTPLFERNARGTRLTEAGSAFLPRALALLLAARAAQNAARAAAMPARITIGHVAALLVTPAVRALRQQRPDADIRTLHLDWREPGPALLEERIDVAVARLPFPTEGLRIRHLYHEPRVLLVAHDHRLAARPAIVMADIADEPVPRLPDPNPEWAAFWRVDPRPDGRPAPLGPVVETPEDRLEIVAGGHAVALATGSIRNGHLRPDLTAIPIADAEPVSVVLAVRDGDHRRLVGDFARLATIHLTGPGHPAAPEAGATPA